MTKKRLALMVAKHDMPQNTWKDIFVYRKSIPSCGLTVARKLKTDVETHIFGTSDVCLSNSTVLIYQEAIHKATYDINYDRQDNEGEANKGEANKGEAADACDRGINLDFNSSRELDFN
jgi:hypothetical protein